MSANSLPRPSWPTMAPPTGPLPSLPVPKTRTAQPGPATPSRLPPPSLARAVSSSALPTRATPRHTTSPSVPLLPVHAPAPASASALSPAAQLPAGKSLRKTVSIGAFPQPPKYSAAAAARASPLATSCLPGPDMAATAAHSPGPSRTASLPKPRTSHPGGNPGLLPRSPLSPPSLLHGGTGSVPLDTAHRRPPSPPQSRPASLLDDEGDGGEDDTRGRGDAKAKDAKGNVIVSVRVRPDVAARDSSQDREWAVDSTHARIVYQGREGGDYVYDNVFDTQDNNARVYDAAAKRLVRRVMEGYHGTVFAYGMTGTGKTFSMQGTATNPGVIPLAITDIFSYIRETPHREFLLRVSYLEIYNERIHDLLAGPVAAAAHGQPTSHEEIKLREDSKRGVYATPLKEEIVQSPTQLLRVIARGDNARRVAGTQFNARSSRSHAVVQIVVESRERAPGLATGTASTSSSKRAAIVPGGVRVSTLSLIDLAGSEKAADNKERRTEGAHINKSLLTLGTVIGRLASDKDKDAKAEKHLPYRDSKLTRLLQPALSGNSLVSILCTIQIGANGSSAAAASHTGETINTLKFASRAKNNIVSHAKKADESTGGGGDAGSRALLDRYRLEIQELKKQLEAGKAKEKEAKQDAEEEEEQETNDKEDDISHIIEEEKAREQQDKQRHEEQMLEMQLARTALKERIEHLNRLILSSKSIGVNGRSFSALGFQRGSTASTTVDVRPSSVRSSASHATLEVPKRRCSHPALALDGSEEDDSLGENGDGTATHAVQIHALQADLADKNRYIATLEKRLLHARRSSHSRVSRSMSKLTQGTSEDGGLIATINEKDVEIANLRAQLEDKERMIAALTSARKKNDTAHDVTHDGSPGSRRTSSNQRSSEGSSSAHVAGKNISSPSSPKPFLPPVSNTGKNIEEMTRMLDEMITGRVDKAAGRRPSLMPVSEGY